ncbi:amino acid permease [Corynebacterium uberis]|uniref:amino acid permease n=1 Tax=Corynebacterium TaxID=1716 RepID=UPI001D0B2867|nr:MULTISPECIES: amino acid permease [Corynebacterium]MCZ9309662.1 amino acid permease [Corynebacterium sp. c6VSa_13]UDL73465.1 amino acid permease [Corynebacterium uberis]UDL75655.1 amino acid permease [Corynebacterium uberis]UDL77868.1 amino acid permease [Corynebacterium uberis]UDL80151.1 amino acid permease [Corynebacterium uberis]
MTEKAQSQRRRFNPDEDKGLQKGLSRRQLQMIAMGSAIGTGLFLGTGARLETAGPSLALLYLVCGFMGYLILRNLGELVVYRPSSGSFVSYAREFYGEKAAYATGWMYWFNWAMTAVADGTAIAIYIKWFGQYSQFIAGLPQWLLALTVVLLVLALNLVSVKLFGELEFWFSAVKIGALTLFLIIGIFFVIFGSPSGQPVGLSLISDAGGWFPNGVLPAVIVIQGVVFAYAGIELLGTTSGEAKNARVEIPKAINLVIFRISVFYCGSVLLLCMLLPYTDYSATESPFVTFFDSIGVDAAAPIMQLIVITAALSSLNAGLYSTGRIMYNLAQEGSAPQFAARLTRGGVPYGGILLTTVVALIGVGLNYVVPEQTFEIVLNLAALGTMASWAAITVSHLKFVRLSRAGEYERPDYRDRFAPWTNYLVIAFLAVVIVLMALDYPVGSWTLIVSLLFIPALIIGWKVNRRRIIAAVDTRQRRRAAREARQHGEASQGSTAATALGREELTRQREDNPPES